MMGSPELTVFSVGPRCSTLRIILFKAICTLYAHGCAGSFRSMVRGRASGFHMLEREATPWARLTFVASDFFKAVIIRQNVIINNLCVCRRVSLFS
jgi:hypothetical protein